MSITAQNVNEIIGVLAEKFGTTASHLWQVLLRQALIEAKIDLGISIFLGITAICFGKYIYYLIKKPEKDWREEDNIPWLIAIEVALVLILIVFAISSLNSFLNPEYRALQKVFNAFKQ
jgi:H+/Cl- antiporter ClcA